MPIKNATCASAETAGAVESVLERHLEADRVTSKSIDGEKAVVRALFDALERQGVRYCHWKSNIRLQDTLAGREDIDLLVDRRDGQLFFSVIAAAGYRLTHARANDGHPGVFHALALDEATAELVDLHAHFQIVSGDSIVKNYRLPIEDAFLRGTHHLHGVRVPAPAVELAVFAVRIMLKHLGPAEVLKCNRHYDEVPTELAWLLERASVDEAASLCTKWFPGIDRAMFDKMLRAIANKGALVDRIVIGRRVARRLRQHRRLPALASAGSRLRRLLSYLLRKLRRRRDLAPLTGGLIIALVGPKGTGKSTIGSQISARLGGHLGVKYIHAGKPPATLLSWLPVQLIPLARRLIPGERLSEYEKPEKRGARRYSMVHVIRRYLLGHDRRRLLQQASRAAASGMIVVSDRYPSATFGAIDGSVFDTAALQSTRSRLKQRLMIAERSLYRGLPQPRLVLRLVAPLQVAIERDARRVKPGGPDAEAVQRRWAFENLAEFPEADVREIDTCGSLEETVRTAVRTVWSAL